MNKKTIIIICVVVALVGALTAGIILLVNGKEPPHAHEYGSWQYNDAEHWKECSCGQTTDNGAHAWGDGEVTAPPQVNADGERTYTCSVCEKTKTEKIDALIRLNHISETYEIDYNSIVFDWKGNDLDKAKTEISPDQSQVENYIKSATFKEGDAIVVLSDTQFANASGETCFYDIAADGKTMNFYDSEGNFESKTKVSDTSASFNDERNQITVTIVIAGDGGSTVSATYGIIEKTAVMVPPAPITSFVFDEMEKIVIDVQMEDLYEIVGGQSKGTNAGAYSVTIALKDKVRTKWSDDTLDDKTIEWEITKAQSSIAFNDDYDPSRLYDGMMIEQPMSDKYLQNGGGETTVEWYQGETKLDDSPVNAGVYKVKVVVAENENYFGSTAEKEFTISQKGIIIQIVKVYDGSTSLVGGEIVQPQAHNAVLAVDNSDVVFTISDNAATSLAKVGSYYLSDLTLVSLSGDKSVNYKIINIEGIINKAPTTIAFNESYVPIKVYDGKPALAPTAADYTVSREGAVTVKWYDEQDLQNADDIPAPTDVCQWQYYVEISVDATDNYWGASAVIEFEVVVPSVQFNIISSEDYVNSTIFVGTVEKGTIRKSDSMRLVVNGQIIDYAFVTQLSVHSGGTTTNPTSVDTETVGTVRVYVSGEWDVDFDKNPMLVVID